MLKIIFGNVARKYHYNLSKSKTKKKKKTFGVESYGKDYKKKKKIGRVGLDPRPTWGRPKY